MTEKIKGGSDAKSGPKLTTESYKGVRDFYPEDMFIQNYIFEVWKKTAEQFGYQEYSASVLEPSELYRAKSGEEIVNEQTYSFKDRGDRDVTLRPEMTPTAARMVAARKRELGFPLRWYSIPNLFRYEQPQRGRVREHWQLNVDVFGVDSIEADIEVISLAHQIMKNLGAKDSDFEIRIGNAAWFHFLSLSVFGDRKTDENVQKLKRLLDQWDKLSSQRRDDTLKELNIPAEALSPEYYDLSEDEKLRDQIHLLPKMLTERGITNVTFDFKVVRGFDYYTGSVFEIFDTDPVNRRSIFGGGRYDDLLALFGNEKVAAFGFGVGDVTIRDFLETHGLLPPYSPSTSLSICPFSEKQFDFCAELAGKLRDKGLNISIDFSGRKIADQIKAADKQHIPYILVIGEDEIKSQVYKIKNLGTGVETVANEAQIAEIIKKAV